MKKRGLIVLVICAILMVSNGSVSFANGDLVEENQEVDTVQTTIPEIEQNQNQDENGNSTETPIAPFAVGDTISSTFPDPAFALAVANTVAGGDVNAILTQSMIDGCTTLTATFKNIQDISGIEYLVNLQTAYLYDNKITSLPVNIGNLTKLQTFHIYNNQITSLPDSLGNLESLQVLHISNNLLTELPDSFGNLINLQTLYSVNNQLTKLPDTFGGLSSLEIVRMTQNELTSLPQSIGSLANLKELRLFQNHITCLPDGIGSLAKLTLLDLGENQLTSLPESIGSLSSLTTLYLDYSLLPADYNVTLNTLGLNFTVNYEVQRQLILKTGLSPYTITNESDINNINLFDIINLSDNAVLSTGHDLILDNYTDENDNPVNIEDYLKNGVVQKTGTIFAQVRSTGTGLFPNNSSRAITVDKIQLDFVATYYDLSFNLNKGEGSIPAAQSLLEGALATPPTEPKREGYTFKGWNTMEDGKGTMWDFATTTMPASDTILYAQWVENTKPIPPVNPTQPTPPVNPTQPKTGDPANTMGLSFLWISLMSAGAILLVMRKKKSREI